MTTPCSAEPELWMSDIRKDQRRAALKCRLLCPTDQMNECGEEGWNHEVGVWGGMSPADRKKADPVRYKAGLSKMKDLSNYLDEVATKRKAATEEQGTGRVFPESQRQEAPPPRTRTWGGEVSDCAVDGCDARATRRGWCTKHYNRWRLTGNPLGKRGKL